MNIVLFVNLLQVILFRCIDSDIETGSFISNHLESFVPTAFKLLILSDTKFKILSNETNGFFTMYTKCLAHSFSGRLFSFSFELHFP